MNNVTTITIGVTIVVVIFAVVYFLQKRITKGTFAARFKGSEVKGSFDAEKPNPETDPVRGVDVSGNKMDCDNSIEVADKDGVRVRDNRMKKGNSINIGTVSNRPEIRPPPEK